MAGAPKMPMGARVAVAFGPLLIMLFNTGRWLVSVNEGIAILHPLSIAAYGALIGIAALWAVVFWRRTRA